MEGTNYTHVDGVHTLWRDVPGPLVGILTFRVGQADESLGSRGITHLCEHLLLSHFGSTPYAYQGTTGPTTTSFSVRGAPEEVATHLTSISHALRTGAFLERLEHERRVLAIEGRQRGNSITFDHLGRRFGASGPGLISWPEWGLHRLTRDEVWAWATTRFTIDNAVLSLSGPPPTGLRLELFRGAHIPAPDARPFSASLPATTVWDGPVGLTALVERSRASVGALSIFAERVVQTLRHEMGATYSPMADYVPLDGSTALVVSQTDAMGQHGPRVAWQLYQLLGELASAGPTSVEVSRLHDAEKRARTEPDAALRTLAIQADELLHHGQYSAEEELLAKHQAIDEQQVQMSARAMWHSALVAVPAQASEVGWNLPDYQPVGMPSMAGRAQRYRRRSFLNVDNWSRAEWLVCSEHAVALESDGHDVTVAIGPGSILLAYGDGSRVLVDRYGGVVTLRPTAWEHGNDVIDWLDTTMGPERTVAVGSREFGPTGTGPDALVGLQGMDAAARSGKRTKRSSESANDALVGPMRLDQWAPATDLPHSVPDVRRWMPSILSIGWLAHRHQLSSWLEASLPDTLLAFRAGRFGPLDLFAEVGGALYTDMASPAAAPFIADLILPKGDHSIAEMGLILGQAAGRPGEWWMATEQHAPAVWAELDRRWAGLHATWAPWLGSLLSPDVPALKVPPSRCQRVS